MTDQTKAPPEPIPGDSRTIRLRIEGMTCGSCVSRVERALSETPGVASARVNLATEIAAIEATGGALARGDLIRAVRAAGYDADTYRPGSGTEPGIHRTQSAKLRQHRQALAQAVGLGLPILVLHWLAPSIIGKQVGSAIWPAAIEALLALLLLCSPAGAPILAGGFRAIWHRAPNMDALVALGVTVAFLESTASLLRGHVHATHFHAVAMILMFIGAGRFLEARARREATSVIAELAALLPATATRITDEGTETVSIDQVRRGDRIRVDERRTIPVDGEVLAGEGSVDEAAITGEPLPRPVAERDAVRSGSMLVEGTLTIRTTSAGEASTIGRILRAVDDAQSGKTNLQRLADKVAGGFVPVVVILAILTFAGSIALADLGASQAITRAVAVLVVACPCAMGLATPTAVVVATGRAARSGFLFGDPAAIETLGRTTHVLFDKTGTLTRGRPAVTSLETSDGKTEDDILRIAASAEQFAQHPIATAIVAEAQRRGCALDEPSSFKVHPGLGIEAKIGESNVFVGSAKLLAREGIEIAATFVSGTVVHLAENGAWIGSIVLTDELRPDAADAVAELRSMGVRISMVTGDRQETADIVAREIGIEDVHAEKLPEEKLELVRRAAAGGETVAFVGDGINDAPALAAATVGIAFGALSDVASAAAPVTLHQGKLAHVPAAIRLAQRATRIIKQNLFWAFFYNVLAIPLAASGTISPGIAAGAMMCSSLSVVLNALRLRRRTGETAR